MNNYQKNRKLKIIIIILFVILLGGGIIAVVYFARKTNNNSFSENDRPSQNPPEKPDGDSKKDLAQKIKNDLKETINRIKNGSDETSSFVDLNDYIACISNSLDFIKSKEKIFSSDIGTENYQEIINLIKQTKSEREKWIKQRNQEADQKLSNQPDLFYNAYESSFSGEVGD